MRFKGGVTTSQREILFSKDAREISVYTEVIADMEDRAIMEQYKRIPDIKNVPARGKKETAKETLLSDHGLAALTDLVSMHDLMSMKQEPIIPEHDRRTKAALIDALHQVATKRDMKSTYQYLAGVSTVHDSDGEWQVKLSRSRRKRHERFSGEPNIISAVAELVPGRPLTDAHGNVIEIEEPSRGMATAKDTRRRKKIAAARRRAGQPVDSDDESSLHPANKKAAPANPKRKGPKGNSLPGSPVHRAVQTPPNFSATQLTGLDLQSSTDSDGSWMMVGAYLSPMARTESSTSC